MKPRDLFDAAEALLLDFDGPLALLMPPPINEEAAAAARQAIPGTDLPIEITSTTDHLEVLRWTRASCSPEVLRSVEAACTKAELDAAQSCDPSPDAADLFDYAQRRQLPIAIVSNNSREAVQSFIGRRGWTDQVGALACRTTETVGSMKPSPKYLMDAAEGLGIELATAVFVGDSVADVLAGLAAGVPTVGVAKNEYRRHELLIAGAQVVLRRATFGRVLA